MPKGVLAYTREPTMTIRYALINAPALGAVIAWLFARKSSDPAVLVGDAILATVAIVAMLLPLAALFGALRGKR